jgi:hypothetical protein
MRILITGNMGYVEPVLTRFLRENLKDVELIGFDAGFFGHSLTAAALLPEALLDRQVFGDIRELPAELLDRVDAGDPLRQNRHKLRCRNLSPRRLPRPQMNVHRP